MSPSGGSKNPHSLPDFAVIICDDREYLKDIAKILLYGNFIANGRKWRFYAAADLDLPTLLEIQSLKSLIIWSSPTTSTFTDDEGSLPTPWIKPVVKLIKKAYDTCPKLKIVGLSLGSNLVAYALGGQIKKKELNEAEKMAFNLNRGIFCGKDQITLSPSFYELPSTKAVF